MFTGHVGVDVLGRNTGFLRDQVAQTRCVQNGSRTKDLVTGKTRQLQRHVGHDVHGVRDEHEHGFGSRILQVRHNLAHEVNGGSRQVQT